MRKIIIIYLLLLTNLVACTSNNQGTEKTLTFFSMNTAVSMIASGDNAVATLNKARLRTLELEEKWSVTLNTSEVYKINNANGNTIEVSEDTLGLINYSLAIAQKTNGAFDPTIYPIVKLWGFTTSNFYVPTDDEITETLSNVGFNKVQVQENNITLKEGMSLDFGAVGKGYALDEALDVLKEEGIISALVNFGGNIGLIGNKTNGEKWQIGVKDPQGSGDLGTLYLSDCAVATSGNYQRFFDDDKGNRYGHIMNPTTGRPQESDILSVTVVSPDGKNCDALATAIYVMGKDAAIELWKKEESFELLLIMNDRTALATENLIQDFIAKDGIAVTKITK